MRRVAWFVVRSMLSLGDIQGWLYGSATAATESRRHRPARVGNRQSLAIIAFGTWLTSDTLNPPGPLARC